MLARHLPTGAMVWSSVGTDSAWSGEEHMLANVFDVLQMSNWQRGGGKGNKPDRLKRPGDNLRTDTKKAAIAARAERFSRRHPTQPAEPVTTRKRDARGRFVKE